MALELVADVLHPRLPTVGRALNPTIPTTPRVLVPDSCCWGNGVEHKSMPPRSGVGRGAWMEREHRGKRRRLGGDGVGDGFGVGSSEEDIHPCPPTWHACEPPPTPSPIRRLGSRRAEECLFARTASLDTLAVRDLALGAGHSYQWTESVICFQALIYEPWQVRKPVSGWDSGPPLLAGHAASPTG